jgi:hypothetical protein
VSWQGTENEVKMALVHLTGKTVLSGTLFVEVELGSNLGLKPFHFQYQGST